MKSILVPTEPNDAMWSTLSTALTAAKTFGSRLEGFAVRVSVPTVVAMDVAPSASLAFFEEEIELLGGERRRRHACGAARHLARPVDALLEAVLDRSRLRALRLRGVRHSLLS